MIWIILGIVIFLYVGFSLTLFFLSFTNWDKSPELPVKDSYHIERCAKGYREFDSFEKEDVYIQSFDHHKLHGYFIKNEKSNKVVISFHGFNTEARKEYPLHYSYYNAGYTVLIVDQRGVGKSKGRFITMGVLERFDCLKWIDYIVARYHGEVEIVLDGLSMGASTIMMAAKDIHHTQVKGMILNSGFNSCKEELAYVITRLMKLPRQPVLWTAQFLARIFAKYDMEAITACESMAQCEIPLLMIHGEKDTFVPYENLHKIFPCAKAADKKMVSVENASHGIACFVDPERFDSEIQQYLAEIDF
ncbi:MAG: alpha/beta fold hydrolase [Ruminococcaceae bacterium]|nr:alpha/beta fold hydrolase [Oscillospiraceae bacterium]